MPKALHEEIIIITIIIIMLLLLLDAWTWGAAIANVCAHLSLTWVAKRKWNGTVVVRYGTPVEPRIVVSRFEMI
jgi:hypothetical protein